MKKPIHSPPREVKFLLCEDVRREESGKLLIAGLFPAELVVLNNPVADKAKKIVGAIQRLCFAFIASKGVGTFETRLKIQPPGSGNAFDRELAQMELDDRKTATLAGLIQPFPVFAYGVHKVTLTIGSRSYDFEIDISQGVSSSQPVGSVAPKKRMRKKPLR